jgi:hypothetical protein
MLQGGMTLDHFLHTEELKFYCKFQYLYYMNISVQFLFLSISGHWEITSSSLPSCTSVEYKCIPLDVSPYPPNIQPSTEPPYSVVQ